MVQTELVSASQTAPKGLKRLFNKFRSESNSSVSISRQSSPNSLFVVPSTSSFSLGNSILSEKITRYGEKVTVIGTGMSAKVELYHNKKSNELFAIKTFKRKEIYESKSEYRARCSQEFEIIRELIHPNILKAFNFISEASTCKLILEFVPYPLLKTVQLARPQEIEALCFFRQTCEGLAFLHANHIAHRDLKMENLVITNDATLKIIDFGAAFKYGIEKKYATGIAGTECLMSPEATSKLRYDAAKNDIWSLAVLLYSIVFVKFPWKSTRESDPEFKIFKTNEGRSRLIAEYPSKIQSIIEEMLKLNPQNRATINQVLNALNHAGIKAHKCCEDKLHARTLKICSSGIGYNIEK